jgi:Polyketide cyclase / dehydrase and lipid transport
VSKGLACVGTVAHHEPGVSLNGRDNEGVKYSEGPTAAAKVLIAAPIEIVWALVTDINLPARFSNEFRGAEWVDLGPALGSRFVGRNWHKALGEWETISIVNRYEPPRAFGWCVTDVDNPSASWWFELHEQPDGVLLCQGTRMGPGASGLSIAIAAMPEKEERIISRRLQEFEENMRATLEGIKRLAERTA